MPGDRPRAAIRPEPGVSWINLLSQHYRSPEQRSRRLPKLLSRTQHGYGTDRRVTMTLTPGQIALQRKPAHPQVPAGAGPNFAATAPAVRPVSACRPAPMGPRR